MLTSRDLLAAVRAAQGIPSNYRLARDLGIPDVSVTRWNTGAGTPDDPMVLRLAGMAGLDPAETLAAIYAQRTKDEALKGVWQRMAERLAAAPAALAMVILSAVVVASPDAHAGGTTHSAATEQPSVLYYVNFQTLAIWGS